MATWPGPRDVRAKKGGRHAWPPAPHCIASIPEKHTSSWQHPWQLAEPHPPASAALVVASLRTPPSALANPASAEGSALAALAVASVRTSPASALANPASAESPASAVAALPPQPPTVRTRTNRKATTGSSLPAIHCANRLDPCAEVSLICGRVAEGGGAVECFGHALGGCDVHRALPRWRLGFALRGRRCIHTMVATLNDAVGQAATTEVTRRVDEWRDATPNPELRQEVVREERVQAVRARGVRARLSRTLLCASHARRGYVLNVEGRTDVLHDRRVIARQTARIGRRALHLLARANARGHA